MTMKLYQLADEYQQALNVLDDPELPEEVVRDTLEALKGGLVQKGQAVAAFALNLGAEIDAIKAVEKRISDRRKALEARAQRMRDYLKTNMEKAGIIEIKAIDGSFTAKLAKGRPSVVVDDESLIPDDSEFVRWKKEVNKTAIADAIKAGQEVPGAHIETRPSLRLA
ncbi:siphovirus Gp157 family protein [Stutzerimonas nitrititolerans]|uniref:siphovirus Gp157 family protein n=1 Tax=Stutzerimonas nitrititolerans TaxID=2482751 RepID=UPI0028A9199D|nr:siphovirus Gp157 family protein [Stutzerimonas nitrititolerans]